MCQIKPSPCHDEHVVYKIKATGQRTYRIEAYKVVGGQEQYMGPLDMKLDRPSRRALPSIHGCSAATHLGGRLPGPVDRCSG